MSGHSKWHNIQAKKGKTDKARSSVFTKLARYITVAAREGGGDPVMNFSLRLAMEKAKAANMPKENIERAVAKGTGEGGDGVHYEEIMYEGFGPCNIAFLVEALTDNKNRTVSEVKNIFSKMGGSLGSAGAVKWQFNHFGVVRINNEQLTANKINKDEFEMSLMEAGIQDLNENEMGLEILCPVENFQKVLEVVKKNNLEAESSGLEWVAKETIKLSDGESEKVANFFDLLDEMDDVRDVYTNEA